MKIVFYLHHPAQFHLFKHVIRSLIDQQHQVKVFSTKKDVLEDLLNEAKIPYTNFVPAGKKDNKLSTLKSMLIQDWGLFKYCISAKPDLMIGTAAEIAHVGFLLRIPNIFVNEDDVAIVPLVGKVIHPFAKHLLAPDVCNTGDAKKTISYKGYHELAYLHPHLFTPDISIAQRYADTSKPYFILRFAKLTAHHDEGIRGISTSLARAIIQKLHPFGNVYITSERPLEAEFEPYRLNIRSADMHHVLAFAQIYIGDSQTMAAEAGCLGVPFIRCNDFVGKIGYLKDLEDNYRLGYGVLPDQENHLLEVLDGLIQNPDTASEWKQKREKMLQEKIEVATFITSLITDYPNSVL